MEAVISTLLEQFESGRVSRRDLIQGLAAVAMAAAGGGEAAAQTGGFRTINVDHLQFHVPDYGRTRDFYAGLMGMTVANDNGKDACELHFGDPRGVGVRDRTMISLSTAPVAKVDHIALKIDNWDTDRVGAELEKRGLKGRLQRGGAIDTPNYASYTVSDPDGLGVQISGIARPGDRLYR